VDIPEVQVVMIAVAIHVARVAMTVVDTPEVQAVMTAAAIPADQGVTMIVVDIPEAQVVTIAAAIHVVRGGMTAVAIPAARDEMIVADLLNADESITMVRLSTATSLWNAA